MSIRSTLYRFTLLTAILGISTMAFAEPGTWDGKIVQYGKMHEAIGKQQHQGRVRLSALVERPHFFGVAALERLVGEATIHDGKVTVTKVDARGRLSPSDGISRDTQATLLVGAYVPSWSEHRVLKDVGPDELDQYLADVASRSGIDISTPFVFTVEGEFDDMRLHVINGACPLHARLNKIEIPQENRPFEAEFHRIRGTVVGVFAQDAVGNITHPGTAAHMHLQFTDSATGKRVTGHIEQVGLLKGAVLRLPRSRSAQFEGQRTE
jgi:alpha-acetolactate decarboxylase